MKEQEKTQQALSAIGFQPEPTDPVEPEEETEETEQPEDAKKPMRAWEVSFTIETPPVFVLARTMIRAVRKAEKWADSKDVELASVTLRPNVII